MSLKKKLIGTLGPLILAVVILGLVLLLPIKQQRYSKETLKIASTSMAINVIKGNGLKNQAIATGKYVPFFGSSELSRIDAFHPSVLAEKYNRSYRPFLLGAAGTQSLSQYFMLESMGNELKGKKAVFIISPQWFVKGGVNKQMFALYYSPLQTYQWLSGLKKIDANTRYTAKRLLNFDDIRNDTTLKTILIQIIQGKLPTDSQLDGIEFKRQLLNREDSIFARLGMLNKQGHVEKALKKLPTDYRYPELNRIAGQMGKKATSNNPYGVKNSFYDTRIRPKERQLKNSQVKFDYVDSPEYLDFQLVLNQFAKQHIDVQFIIPPVNAKWAKYTGLSQSMLEDFDRKITYQLRSQGFNRVADFTNDGDVPYFMEDTIHLGWRGWLDADQYIAPFLDNKNTEKPVYHINSKKFLSRKWAQASADNLPEYNASLPESKP